MVSEIIQYIISFAIIMGALALGIGLILLLIYHPQIFAMGVIVVSVLLLTRLVKFALFEGV